MMQFLEEFNWGREDFVVAGLIILSVVLAYLGVKKLIKNAKYRVVAGVIVLGAALLLWAELAVGIFTNWGS